MKEKWSKGQLGGTVISDTSSFRNGGADSVEYYGGYLVAESISKSEHVDLIAAAPDLLEACKEALDRLRHVATVEPKLNGYGVRRETIEQLTAAIAKAKGEKL